MPQRRTIVVGLAAVYGMTLAFALASDLPSGQWQTLSAIALVPPLIWLTVTDLSDHVIPDAATFGVASIGLIATFRREDAPYTLALAIVMVGVLAWLGALYWRRAGHEALGLGDAKLIAAGILVVGAEAFWIMLLLASTGGCVAALTARQKAKSGIPFGPFLAYSIFITFTILGPQP